MSVFIQTGGSGSGKVMVLWTIVMIATLGTEPILELIQQTLLITLPTRNIMPWSYHILHELRCCCCCCCGSTVYVIQHTRVTMSYHSSQDSQERLFQSGAIPKGCLYSSILPKISEHPKCSSWPRLPVADIPFIHFFSLATPSFSPSELNRVSWAASLKLESDVIKEDIGVPL